MWQGPVSTAHPGKTVYLKCKFDSLYELFPKSGNLSKEHDTLHLPRHSMAEGQQNLAVPNLGALSEEGQFPPLSPTLPQQERPTSCIQGNPDPTDPL